MGIQEIAGGTAGQVMLLAGEDFSYPVAKGEKITIELPGCGFVYAPVSEGQSAGYAHILLDGVAVGKVPLVYGQSVEQSKEQRKTLWEKLFRDK